MVRLLSSIMNSTSLTAEIVILLCGAVWGLGIGSGIVAAGVILGEGAVYL